MAYHPKTRHHVSHLNHRRDDSREREWIAKLAAYEMTADPERLRAHL